MSEHPNAVIAAGQAAWLRVKQARPQYDDWIAIGRCLAIGKAAALKAGGTNRCYGPKYVHAMGDWLATHGMNDIETQERRGAIWMAENEAELARWRKSLTLAEVRHCNHPSTVARHFKHGTRPSPRGPRKGAPLVRHAAKTSNGVYVPHHRPGGDIIRKVADAMRCSGKQDWLLLACVAIEALSREDLIDLLGKAAEGKIMEPAYGQHVHA